VHPRVKTNWPASTPLVVAYVPVGTVRTDVSGEPLGNDKEGNPEDRSGSLISRKQTRSSGIFQRSPA